jgi:hypothetical protein
MLVSAQTAAAAAHRNATGVNPFAGLPAVDGQVDVPTIDSPKLLQAELTADGTEVNFTIVHPQGESFPMDRLVATAAIAWANALQPLPSAGVVQAGTYWAHDGNLIFIIQTHNRSTFGGDPAQYPALARNYRNPWQRKPWKQPTDQFDAYRLVNAITGLPDECSHAGQDWRTRRDNNVWQPGTGDGGWMRISNLPAPWLHVGNEGYPLGWQVTHNGRLWQSAAAGNFWQPGVALWTDIGAA